MNVELKPVSGREAELAERVAVFLRKAKVDVPLLVSSFSTKCLVELRKEVLKRRAAFCLKSRSAIGLQQRMRFRRERFIRTKIWSLPR